MVKTKSKVKKKARLEKKRPESLRRQYHQVYFLGSALNGVLARLEQVAERVKEGQTQPFSLGYDDEQLDLSPAQRERLVAFFKKRPGFKVPVVSPKGRAKPAKADTAAQKHFEKIVPKLKNVPETSRKDVPGKKRSLFGFFKRIFHGREAPASFSKVPMPKPIALPDFMKVLQGEVGKVERLRKGAQAAGEKEVDELAKELLKYYYNLRSKRPSKVFDESACIEVQVSLNSLIEQVASIYDEYLRARKAGTKDERTAYSFESYINEHKDLEDMKKPLLVLEEYLRAYPSGYYLYELTPIRELLASFKRPSATLAGLKEVISDEVRKVADLVQSLESVNVSGPGVNAGKLKFKSLLEACDWLGVEYDKVADTIRSPAIDEALLASVQSSVNDALMASASAQGTLPVVYQYCLLWLGLREIKGKEDLSFFLVELEGKKRRGPKPLPIAKQAPTPKKADTEKKVKAAKKAQTGGELKMGDGSYVKLKASSAIDLLSKFALANAKQARRLFVKHKDIKSVKDEAKSLWKAYEAFSKKASRGKAGRFMALAKELVDFLEREERLNVLLVEKASDRSKELLINFGTFVVQHYKSILATPDKFGLSEAGVLDEIISYYRGKLR